MSDPGFVQLNPDYPSTWNNAGVLYLRHGDPDTVERAFSLSLALDKAHVPALSNLIAWYRRTHHPQLAQELSKRLGDVRDQDPFHHSLLAQEQEKSGDYTLALKHFQHAIDLMEDEHRFHFGLARACLALSDSRRAGQTLARAHESGPARDRHQAKLDRLHQQLH